MVAERLESLRVELRIATEKQQSLDVTDSLAVARMRDGAGGEGLLVMPHDQPFGMEMSEIFRLAECRYGIGLILGPIDEGRGEGPPAAKRVGGDAGRAAGHMNALKAGCPLQDFSLGGDRLRPLRAE